MKIDLSHEERNLLLGCCDNYYDDEVSGASKILLSIKDKIKNNLFELSKEEASILSQCLDRDVHCMENNVEHPDEVIMLEKIIIKLEQWFYL